MNGLLKDVNALVVCPETHNLKPSKRKHQAI